MAGQTQLNLSSSFATTRSGTVFNATLEAWLNAAGPYTDVTLWHDFFFGSLKTGRGAAEARENLVERLDRFTTEWDSVHG